MGYVWKRVKHLDWSAEHKSVEECLLEARKMCENNIISVYVGEVENFHPEEYVCVMEIIENLSDTAIDECGECALDWEPDIKIPDIEIEEIEKRLQEDIKELLLNNGVYPAFGHVKNVKLEKIFQD